MLLLNCSVAPHPPDLKSVYVRFYLTNVGAYMFERDAARNAEYHENSS